MQDDHTRARRGLRGAMVVIVALAGIATIVASGGGGGDGNCSFFSNACQPVIGPFGGFAGGNVFPAQVTVQVGGTATFTVNTTAANPTYQWRRSADGGRTYTPIAGATAASYTLVGAQLTDDGTLFTTDVTSSGAIGDGTVSSARLAVVSTAGIVYQDGEFVAGDWLATATGEPAQNGPTHTEAQAAAGGDPGAFRQMVQSLPAGLASSRVFNLALAAVYDPAVQGALLAIDFSEECSVTSMGASIRSVESHLLVEQGARKYIDSTLVDCAGPAWTPVSIRPSVSRSDLVLVDGPACGAGEACPDFSAAGAPLRFGYVRDARHALGSPAAAVTHGIDNWKVTVWRK